MILFYFVHRSSGGTKGDSESETADPFIQTKTTNNIKYNNVNISLFYYY